MGLSGMKPRWRIERCGSPTAYLPGWIASNGDVGAVCPTWAEALEFVAKRIESDDRQFEHALAQWGIQRVRRVRADESEPTSPSRRRYHRLSDAERSTVRAHARQGIPVSDIARRYAVSPQTVRNILAEAR